MAKPNKFDPKIIFTEPVVFPNDEANRRLKRLVGLDDEQKQLAHDLYLIFHPHLSKRWSQQHYNENLPILELLEDSVPLFIFEGDVGTGKTALAESIGAKVQEEYDCPVQLIKMSTQVRGTGYVGEMGSLLAESFQYAESLWQKTSTPLILVIDEADSLLTSRESKAQHHEDKSGVNTILQHLDSFKSSSAQIAVIAITNRLGVLDPALKRRATDVLTFQRPSQEQRRALFQHIFTGLGFSSDNMDELVTASEPKGKGQLTPYTYSDLTIRLALQTLRQAIRDDKPITVEYVVERLKRLMPTPAFDEG